MTKPRLPLFSFKTAEADCANHRRVAQAVLIMPTAPPIACYWCEARDSGSQTLLEFRSCIQHAFGREADVIRTNRKERAFGPGVLFLFVARITGLGALAIVDSRISRGRWIVTIPDTVVSFFLEA